MLTTTSDRLLQLFLRIVGTASLLALVAVAMPYRWMNDIHQSLGMGQLPSEPVVGYLARSTSLFYAFLGALLWFLSFHMRQHRAVLRYVGSLVILFGIILCAVDWIEGLPLFWKVAEGPIDILIGLVITILSSRMAPAPPAAPISTVEVLV